MCLYFGPYGPYELSRRKFNQLTIVHVQILGLTDILGLMDPMVILGLMGPMHILGLVGILCFTEIVGLTGLMDTLGLMGPVDNADLMGPNGQCGPYMGSCTLLALQARKTEKAVENIHKLVQLIKSQILGLMGLMHCRGLITIMRSLGSEMTTKFIKTAIE